MPSIQPPFDLPSDLLGVALRTLVVYVFLIVALRVAGKREVGQLSPFDLVLLLIVSNGVQNAMVGTNTSLWGGLVTVVVLFGADRVLRMLRTRSPRVDRLLEGEPVLLVRNGEILDEALRREGIDEQDLQHVLRAHGVGDMHEVATAVLEIDGTVSVIPAASEVHQTRETRTTRRLHRRRPNLPLS
jgi:uncharacterized membrane protein YcaP (DUF421 family)